MVAKSKFDKHIDIVLILNDLRVKSTPLLVEYSTTSLRKCILHWDVSDLLRKSHKFLLPLPDSFLIKHLCNFELRIVFELIKGLKPAQHKNRFH
jgi:hypothetical protein